jgi:hypothetical protein
MTKIYLPNIQPIPKGKFTIIYIFDIYLGIAQKLRAKFNVSGIIDHSYDKRSLYFHPATSKGIFTVYFINIYQEDQI